MKKLLLILSLMIANSFALAQISTYGTPNEVVTLNNEIYATTYTLGVYPKSNLLVKTSGGWVKKGKDISGAIVIPVEQYNNEIYTGDYLSSGTLYKLNSDSNWNVIYNYGHGISELAATSNKLYVLDYIVLMNKVSSYSKADGFKDIADTSMGFTSIATSNNSVYAGVNSSSAKEQGVLKYIDEDSKWVKIAPNSDVEVRAIDKLAIDKKSNMIFALAYTGIYGLSLDKNDNWKPIANKFGPKDYTQSLAVADINGVLTIFVGTTNGKVYKSGLNDASWIKVGDDLTKPGEKDAYVRSLAIQGNTLYVVVDHLRNDKEIYSINLTNPSAEWKEE